jgi:hypothetical protein
MYDQNIFSHVKTYIKLIAKIQKFFKNKSTPPAVKDACPHMLHMLTYMFEGLELFQITRNVHSLESLKLA